MDGNFIDGGVQDGGHNEIGESMLYGTPYILYQLILPELLLDCFCMLCGLSNQISSSAHSSVVQGHVERLDTWFLL